MDICFEGVGQVDGEVQPGMAAASGGLNCLMLAVDEDEGTAVIKL